jgi:hypothetical protein
MVGSTTAQGYGWRHQQQRAHWAKVIEADGGTWCQATVCLMPSRWITPNEPWDLGHEDGQRGWRGPEHRTCNRTDGAHKSNTTGNPGASNPKPRRRRRRVELTEVSVDPSDL